MPTVATSLILYSAAIAQLNDHGRLLQKLEIEKVKEKVDSEMKDKQKEMCETK